jgi:beta-lactamase superfamily II metal-dependent hydrolase
MKLTMFPADKGDCLLLRGADGTNVLIDGGMRQSYSQFVAVALGRIRNRKERLRLVCVSHIDQDHISGVLQLLDDMAAWRVHDYRKKDEDRPDPPAVPRPPEIDGIWHNAFHEQIGKNSGPVQQMLAASAALLSALPRERAKQAAGDRRELATSVKEALQLSRRIRAGQLKIPLNREFDHRLVMTRDGARPIRVGSMKFTVIAPFQEDLRNLREEWNTWLRENQDELREVQRRSREDEDLLQSSELDRLLSPLLTQADVLGRRERVTLPNLASIMIFVEEAGRTLLLTGDGHASDILKGLERTKKLAPEAGMHVNLLKVQHHGSEHNIDRDFCKRITADRYVFCADGAHDNPDLGAVEAIIDSRVGGQRNRSRNAETQRPFTLWFNSSSSILEGKQKDHLTEVERLVRDRATPAMRVVFRSEPSRGKSLTV